MKTPAAIAVLASVFIFATALAASPIAHVVEVGGQAYAIATDQTKRVLKVGDAISEGEKITTSDSSSVKLVLNGGGALLIKANSEIDLNGTTPDPKFSASYDVKLVQGSLLSLIKGGAKKPPVQFKVRTKSATMGVRGTSFFVQDLGGPTDKTHPVFFCPCMGKIHVESINGNEAVEFETTKHDTPILISPITESNKGTLKERMKGVPKGFDANHSDEEIAGLRDLANK